jgi:hypothetical protein
LFVVGLCGAAVAVGTYYFELMGKTGPAYNQLLQYGLLGGALALAVTGALKLLEGNVLDEPGEEADGA